MKDDFVFGCGDVYFVDWLGVIVEVENILFLVVEFVIVEVSCS